MSDLLVKSAQGVPRLEFVPLTEVARWPRNPKAHDKEAIRASIKKFGFRESAARDERTGRLVAGHGRLEVLLEMYRAGEPPPRYLPMAPDGTWLMPVLCGLPFDSDEEAEQYVIASNRVGELGGWEKDILPEVLRDHARVLGGLEGTGFDLQEADEIIREHDRLLNEYRPPDLPEGETPQEEKNEDPDDDLQDLPPGPPRSVLGTPYECGQHRVMCGDSADPKMVTELVAGARCDLHWTDPPYNVGSESTNFAADTSKSLGRLKQVAWDKNYDPIPALENGLGVLQPDATVYVCTSHFLAPAIWTWMGEWADHHSFCGWKKRNPSPSLAKRHWTWDMELICYATRGKHTFNFPKKGHCPSTWEFSKVAKAGYCPTPKPVALVMHAVAHSSRRGANVLDLHGGAGSTLIACEKLGRKAYIMEKDPLAVDEIRDRWTRFAARKAGKPR